MKMNGKDQISNEISQSITQDITQLMISGGVSFVKNKEGEVRLMNQSQDSGEFLSHLMGELARDGLQRIFQFESLEFSQYECSDSECSRIYKQPVRDPRIIPRSFMILSDLGCRSPKEVVVVWTLIQGEMGVGAKVENTRKVNASSELC